MSDARTKAPEQKVAGITCGDEPITIFLTGHHAERGKHVGGTYRLDQSARQMLASVKSLGKEAVNEEKLSDIEKFVNFISPFAKDIQSIVSKFGNDADFVRALDQLLETKIHNECDKSKWIKDNWEHIKNYVKLFAMYGRKNPVTLLFAFSQASETSGDTSVIIYFSLIALGFKAVVIDPHRDFNIYKLRPAEYDELESQGFSVNGAKFLPEKSDPAPAQSKSKARIVWENFQTVNYFVELVPKRHNAQIAICFGASSENDFLPLVDASKGGMLFTKQDGFVRLKSDDSLAVLAKKLTENADIFNAACFPDWKQKPRKPKSLSPGAQSLRSELKEHKSVRIQSCDHELVKDFITQNLKALFELYPSWFYEASKQLPGDLSLVIHINPDRQSVLLKCTSVEASFSCIPVEFLETCGSLQYAREQKYISILAEQFHSILHTTGESYTAKHKGFGAFFKASPEKLGDDIPRLTKSFKQAGATPAELLEWLGNVVEQLNGQLYALDKSKIQYGKNTYGAELFNVLNVQKDFLNRIGVDFESLYLFSDPERCVKSVVNKLKYAIAVAHRYNENLVKPGPGQIIRI